MEIFNLSNKEFEVLKERKKSQTRIFSAAKPSFKTEGETKTVPNKQKPREIIRKG